MTRQATDQLYVDLGYFTPEEYFTYQANAAAAITSEASMSASAGVIKSNSAQLQVSTSVTAVISNILGADLFAFTEAELAAQVDRIRDNNIDASAQFDLAIDYIRLVSADIFESAVFTVEAFNERSRAFESQAQAAFSLACDYEVLIPSGQVVEASGAWFADVQVQAQGQLTQSIIIDITSSANLEVSANLIKESTVDFNSSLELSLESTRIRDFALDQNALFTLSLTIDVIKNSFAVLDCYSIINVTAELFRDNNVQLSAETNFSVINNKIVYQSSNINSTTDLSITAEVYRFVSAAGTWTASSILSGSALVTPFRLASARHPFTAYNGARIVADTTKFGSGALYLPTSSSYIQSDSNTYGTDFNIAGNSQFAIGLWFRPITSDTQSIIKTNPDGQGWEIGYLSNGNIIFYIGGYSVNLGASGIVLNNWNWICLNRYYNGAIWLLRLYVNGVLKASTSFVYGTTTTNPQLTIGSYPAYYDGVMFDKNGIDKVPTSMPAYEYNTGTDPSRYITGPELILNFNGSSLDSALAQLELGQAAITCTSTVSALANANKPVSAIINAQTSITCNLLRIPTEADSTIIVTSALDSNVGAIRLVDAEVTLVTSVDVNANSILSAEIITESIFTEMAVVARVADFFINCDVVSVQQIEPVKTTNAISNITGISEFVVDSNISVNAESNLTAFTVQDSTVDRFAGLDSEFNVQSDLTVSTSRTLENSAVITCYAGLTAETGNTRNAYAVLTTESSIIIDNIRTRTTSSTVDVQSDVLAEASIVSQAASDINSSTELTTISDRIRNASLDIIAMSSELAAVTKIADFFINCDVVANLTANVNADITAIVNLTSSTEQSALIHRIRDTNANFDSNTQLEITAISNRDVTSFMNSTVELICTAVESSEISADLIASTDITVNAERIRLASAETTVVSSLTITSTKIVNLESIISTSSSLTAICGILATANADLVAFNTQLTLITVVHIDPYLTWVIEPEQRVYVIAPEQREYIVEREVRTYIIRN